MINYKVLLKSISDVLLAIAGITATVIGVVFLIKYVNEEIITGGIVILVVGAVLVGWVCERYSIRMRIKKIESNATRGGIVG